MRVVLVTLMMVTMMATLMKEWKSSLIGLRPNASKVHDVQCTLQFAQCKVRNVQCILHNAQCTMQDAQRALQIYKLGRMHSHVGARSMRSVATIVHFDDIFHAHTLHIPHKLSFKPIT